MRDELCDDASRTQRGLVWVLYFLFFTSRFKVLVRRDFCYSSCRTTETHAEGKICFEPGGKVGDDCPVIDNAQSPVRGGFRICWISL